MTIQDAGSILELRCFEVVGPQEENFEALCTEIKNDLNAEAKLIVADSKLALATTEDQEAATLWLNASGSERRRVVENIALEWMSADEQMANFGDTCKEES